MACYVAINNWNWWLKTSVFSSVQSFSCVWPFVTPWTAAHQASLSITNSCSRKWRHGNKRSEMGSFHTSKWPQEKNYHLSTINTWISWWVDIWSKHCFDHIVGKGVLFYWPFCILVGRGLSQVPSATTNTVFNTTYTLPSYFCLIHLVFKEILT